MGNRTVKRLLADIAATTLIVLTIAAPAVFMLIAWPYAGIFSLISLVAYWGIWEWLRDYIGLPLPTKDTDE